VGEDVKCDKNAKVIDGKAFSALMDLAASYLK